MSESLCCSQSSDGFTYLPERVRDVHYPQSHIVLAGFSSSLPLEVPIYLAAELEFVRDGARKADDGFQTSEGGSETLTGPFYKNIE